MTSRRELYWVGGCGLLLAALFLLFPGIDLWASGLFRTADGQWLFDRDDPLLYVPYRLIPLLGRGLLVALLGIGLLALVPAARRRWPSLGRWGRMAAFLLAAAALGQGLIIDVATKGFFERARPFMVQPFDGERQFTPAFVPAGECERNCSFVSGHVGNAAFIMAFGWLAAPTLRRRWLLASIAAAGLMAAARLAPGAHFLSDAVFSWFATYLSLWLTEWLFRRCRWLP